MPDQAIEVLSRDESLAYVGLLFNSGTRSMSGYYEKSQAIFVGT